MSEEYARLVVAVSDTGVDSTARGLEKMERAGGKAERATDKLRRSVGGLRGALAGLGAGFAYREIIQAADQYQSLQAQLRLVSDSSEQAADSYEKLREVANETSSDLSSSVELYARLARSTEDLGLSQEQLLNLTKSINQSFQVSGASTEEAAGAIRQLSQAFASGALRGDEFNTVNEAAPRLMEAIADATGRSRGELRELAGQGKLTAEVIAKAMENQASTIQSEFEQLPDTVGRAMQRLKNDALDVFGETDTSGLVDAIDEIRELISDPAFQENMVALATGVADVLGVAAQSISNIVGLAREMGISIARAAHDSGDELFELQESLAALERAQTNSLLRFNWSGTSTGFELYMDDAEIAREIDLVRSRINKLLEERGLQPLGDGEGDAPAGAPTIKAKVDLGDGGEADLTPIQKRIAALELEAKTIGLSSKAAELYKLEQKGATDEQIRAAAVALDRIEAEEGLQAAREAAAEQIAEERADFTSLVESLRTEEEIILQSYQARRQMILDNEEITESERQKLLARLREDNAGDVLDGFGSAAAPESLEEKEAAIIAEYQRRMELIEQLEGDQTELELELARRRDEQLREIEEERNAQITDGYSALLDVMGKYYEGMEGKEAAYARAAIQLGQVLLDEKKRESLQKIISSTHTAAMGAYEALASIPYVGPALGAAAAGGIYVAGGAAAGKVAGLYDEGGHIPAGKVGIVGEYGPEFVRGPANVTSRKETAAMAREAGKGGGGGSTTVLNVMDPSLVGDFLETDAGERMVMNILQRNPSAIASLGGR